MTGEDCVLIAGAGPVGTITGLCLARAGIPVKLFDALSEVPVDHRAATLQPSTLDLAQHIGLTTRQCNQIYTDNHRQFTQLASRFDPIR